MSTRHPAPLLWLCALSLALSAPGCKKPPETEVPDEGAGAGAGEDEEDEGEGEEAGGDPIAFEDFQETADYRTHTVIDCYTTQFEGKKDAPTGKLVVQITVAGDGSVPNAEFDPNSTLKDDALTECALERIKSWKFDETGASETVVHPFTFDFRPGELLK